MGKTLSDVRSSILSQQHRRTWCSRYMSTSTDTDSRQLRQTGVMRQREQLCLLLYI